MRAIRNLWTRIRNLVVSEIPVITAIVFAALNTATVRSPIGYAGAVATALVRFAVSPAFEKKALEAAQIDPKIIEAVRKLLADEQAAKAVVPVAVDPSVPAFVPTETSAT
jgi:hypothetical protein